METVARRGYRFIADVAAAESEPVAPPESGTGNITPVEGGRSRLPARRGVAGRLRRSYRWTISGIALVVSAIVVACTSVEERRSRPIRSLAVLPLENLSGDDSQEYFADGMTDELIATLGQISALRVISRTSVMP